MTMIIRNQREDLRKTQGTKCLKNAFRLIGRMSCKQLGLAIFLVAGGLCLLFWSLYSGSEVSNSINKRSRQYGYEDEQDSSRKGDDSSDLDMPRKMLGLIDENHISDPDLAYRIRELVRIKTSVQKELHALEAQRAEMQRQIAAFADIIEDNNTTATRKKWELEKLQITIEQAKLTHKELSERNTPELLPPLRMTAELQNKIIDSPQFPINGVLSCTMNTESQCFDWSRCPISSGYPIYFYENDNMDDENGWVISVGRKSGYFTSDPNEACLFVVSVDYSSESSKEYLRGLSHWNGNGKNHLIIDTRSLYTNNRQPENNPSELSVQTDSAMIASPFFGTNLLQNNLREGYDLLLPTFRFHDDSANLWPHLPYMLPLRRKYLFSFQGVKAAQEENFESSPQRYHVMDGTKNTDYVKSHRFQKTEFDQTLQRVLEGINFDRTDDRVLVNFSCRASSTDNVASQNKNIPEWALCGDILYRQEILRQSTFSLIIYEAGVTSSFNFQLRLSEALKEGPIPVIICVNIDCDIIRRQSMPFSEVIDYKQLVLFLPAPRLPELHFILRSWSDSDLSKARHTGRLIWQTYLGSSSTVTLTLLNTIRNRLGLPPAPFESAASPQVFNSTLMPIIMDHHKMKLPNAEEQEFLGPIEPPMASPMFRRNFSSLVIDSHSTWNTNWGAAFRMATQTPWKPLISSDAKFMGSNPGFRPVNGGEGGAGREFSQALGGNVPQEQFTVVMLTYEREQVLIESLIRLYSLPYLNKVIVVWNSPDVLPSTDLEWPDIGVPIKVIKAEKNSLNNRFIPFDEIQTEAVLSVDDDAHLRHDEIIFGFRVWREHRDRLVGFPGRFHAWNQDDLNWNYNSNYSCELSMVLTGAAFYHNYYNYAYTQLMPQSIRDKVDEYMNCEDLAMNFLISHLTRQPPKKVTSRWTFRCPGCPVTLSEDDSHFQERHQCINFFAQVYGYMPLLNTQYRADSVLFKTRIPQDKKKCFKFI